MQSNYSSKEELIFNSVLSLIKEGKNLRDLTVLDIATSANIGKGTVYGYFTSKEEIIGKALLFSLEREHQKLLTKLNFDHSFKDNLYQLYDFVFESAQFEYSIFSLIGAIKDLQELNNYFKDSCQKQLEKFEESNKSLFSNLIKKGFYEKKLSYISDPIYVELVVFSNIAMIGRSAMKQNLSADMIEKIKDSAYTQLIKSLN